MSGLRNLLRTLVQRRRFERELDDELAFHVAARADQLERDGVARAEALRRARLELGMAELHKSDVRAAKGLAPFDGLMLDLRQAARSLLRNRLFALTTVAILALAIAANAALFAFFEAYVLRAPDVRAPGRTVDVLAGYDDGQVAGLWPMADAEALAAAGAGTLEGTWLANNVRVPLLGDAPKMTFGLAVSASYFDLLGARMQRGRTFDVVDERTREPVLVLSAAGWRRLAHADPDVLGSVLKLGPTSYTVIGIAAEGFRGLDVVTPEYWIPRAGAAAIASDIEATTMGGVLREGVTVAQAQDALATALAGRTAEDGGPTRVVVAARTSMFDGVEAGTLKAAAIPVFAGFLLVLLVACANLANVALARAAARRRELAIRVSVGASRWRVARHLLVESLLLAALAAAVGTLVCAGVVAALQRFVFADVGAVAPDLVPPAFEWGRSAYAALLALVAALAIGLAPALEAGAQSPVHGVRNLGTDGRARTGRLRDVLLVGQIAASAVLLVLAGLIVANERRVDDLDPGYDVARIVDTTFPVPTERALRELERVPGVAAVTAVARAPLYGRAWTAPVRVAGGDVGVGFNHVDDRFFATLGIGLARGRAFLPEEARNEANVAIVSAATARLLFGAGDPLGRTFEVTTDLVPIPVGRYEVVGVADDVASGIFLEGRDRAMVYFPTAIGGKHAGALLARVSGDVAATSRAIVDACTRANASVLCEPTTLAAVVQQQRVPFAVAGAIATALGCAALAISCIGLYGVVGFTVARRTREIGVRIALGATPRAVLRFVLDGAVRRIVLGLALGLPVCIAISALVAAQLEVIRAFDSRAYLAMPLLLALVAFVAAFVPARRAARIAPTEALREDG